MVKSHKGNKIKASIMLICGNNIEPLFAICRRIYDFVLPSQMDSKLFCEDLCISIMLIRSSK